MNKEIRITLLYIISMLGLWVIFSVFLWKILVHFDAAVNRNKVDLSADCPTFYILNCSTSPNGDSVDCDWQLK